MCYCPANLRKTPTAASLGPFANPTPKYPEVYSGCFRLSNKDRQSNGLPITLELAQP